MKKKKTDYDLAQNLFKHHFIEHGSPFTLMSSFVFARQHGETPPEYVLNFIAKVFDYYFKLKGQVSLDVLFGVKEAKKNSFKLYMIMYNVHMLRKLTGCNVPDAVEQVIDYYRTSKEYTDFYFSPEKLKDIYSRQKWATKLDRDPMFQWDSERLSKTEDKEQYLNKFNSYNSH